MKLPTGLTHDDELVRMADRELRSSAALRTVKIAVLAPMPARPTLAVAANAERRVRRA
jgi:hypothetical protein